LSKEQQLLFWTVVEETLVVSVSRNALCKRHIECWLFFLSATSCRRRQSYKSLSELLAFEFYFA
jgi:hypothetical protein